MNWYFVLVLIVLALAGYYRLSTLSFTQYKPTVSSLYCSFASTKDIPEYPVIVVPGLKGSLLEKDGRIVWLNTRSVFASYTDSPLTLLENDGVTPVGVFTRVVTIPYFLEYRGYHQASVDMACAKHGYTFYYDWRKSPQEIIPDLAALVERVTSETGKKPAIVSHSYGGLITRGYIQEYLDTLAAIVFTGVPFDPGPGFLDGDLKEGSPVFTNKELLSAEVTATHRSSYYLIPPVGNTTYQGKNAFDAKVWREDAIGPYAHDQEYPLHLLEKELAAAASFNRFIRQEYRGTEPVLVVRGEAQKTLQSITSTGEYTYGLGDGRVSANSTMPPGIDSARITEQVYPIKHSKQFQNKEVLRGIYQFITQNTSRE